MGDNDGRHDFDFYAGTWRIANRKRVNMVVPGDDEWVEFEATSEARQIIGGLGNIDTYSAPDFPGRPGFEAFTLRLFEPKTALWRIWWTSAANPAPSTRPVVGRFGGRTGSAGSNATISSWASNAVRYEWTVIDEDTLKWEQFFSFDGRRTWESNWVMDSTRIASFVNPNAALYSQASAV
jgi:hypothetical protein